MLQQQLSPTQVLSKIFPFSRINAKKNDTIIGGMWNINAVNGRPPVGAEWRLWSPQWAAVSLARRGMTAI